MKAIYFEFALLEKIALQQKQIGQQLFRISIASFNPTYTPNYSASWPFQAYWLDCFKKYQNLVRLTGDNKVDEILLFDKWNETEWVHLFSSAVKKTGSIFEASAYCLRLIKRDLKYLLRDPHCKKFPYAGKYQELKKNKFDSFFYLSQKPPIAVSVSHQPEKAFVKVEWALSFLKTYLPESFELLKLLTCEIHSLRDRKLVSYSLQTLPGVSFINLYHRDRLDLLDDLLHENGHHILNVFLNQMTLINEDSSALFYSPWRECQRPLRGIYHGYLTFFHAEKLFYELLYLQHRYPHVMKKIFTRPEQKKIKARYYEEKALLNAACKSLRLAHKNKLITAKGFDFILQAEEVRKEHLKFS